MGGGRAHDRARRAGWWSSPANIPLYWLLTGVAAILGVLLTISIGGADMPVAIALLNSYSGLAGCATGFVITNSVLIVAGSLVGASGIILTQIMCKAMNRSMTNVLFCDARADRRDARGRRDLQDGQVDLAPRRSR